MRGGRGDKGSSRDDATLRGGRVETTQEYGDEDQSRHPHISSIKSQAKRLKNKVLPSEMREDGESELHLPQQTLRYRRKADAFSGSAEMRPTDWKEEVGRPAPRSKSSVFFGNVLDERKRELQSAVIGLKSKMQTPRKSVFAQSDPFLEPSGEIGKANISSVRPLLKKEAHDRRKTSLYQAVMQQATSIDYGAEENNSDLLSTGRSIDGEKAVEAEIMSNELKSRVLLSPGQSESETGAEGLKLDKKGLHNFTPRPSRWGIKPKSSVPNVEQGLSRENITDDTTGVSMRVGVLFGNGLHRGVTDEKKGKNFQSVLTELTSNIQTPQRATSSFDRSSEPELSNFEELDDSFSRHLKLVRPKINLRRKGPDLTAGAVFSRDSSEIEKEFSPSKGENSNSNRAILEEKKREFQNVITELKAKIQITRRSECLESKPHRLSLSEDSPVDQCPSDLGSLNIDRTHLTPWTFEDGGLLKPLRLGKIRKRDTTFDGLEKLKSSEETSISDGNAVDEVLTIAQETFEVASNFFGKHILKKRNHEDGSLGSGPSSTDDGKTKERDARYSDSGEPENVKLAREVCRLREWLAILETEVQNLEVKLSITENSLAAETLRMDSLVTSLNQAQELRYQHLMTVFNENYTMLGSLESQFEQVLSNNYNTRSSTASGRILKMAWLAVDTVCLVLVKIVGFITHSRSYFGRRHAIASRVNTHTQK